MTPEKAQKILEQLAAGKDPKSGRNLPAGGPLNTGDVVRALHIGVMALRPQEPTAVVAKDTRRRPADTKQDTDAARAGKRWTPAEVAAVVTAYDKGISIIALARLHERSRYAVAARLVAEGRDGKLSEVFQADDLEPVATVAQGRSAGELPI